MAVVWQGLGAARGRRSHQMLTEESPEPGRGKLPASSLDSLCTRLSRRLPLGILDTNFRDGPSWQPLGSSEKTRGAGCSAKKALGSVAQKIQGSSQRRELGRAYGGSPHPSRRKRRGQRLVAPSPSSGRQGAALSSQGSGLRRLSRWITKEPLLPLRRRSQREAALRSPYSSSAPLCSTRGGCSEEEEEEPVATGIQQLKHLSQSFDEAIASDERKQAIENYRLLMTHNLRAVCQSERPPWVSGRRRARGLMDCATNVKV